MSMILKKHLLERRRFKTWLPLMTGLFLQTWAAGAESSASKLDPLLGLMLAERRAAVPLLFHKAVTRGDSIHVFVRAKDKSTLESLDFPVHPVSGGIGTAFLPMDQIERMSQIPQVERLEAPSVCRPQIDVSVPMIGADKLWKWNGSGGYKGAGVIIGIVDSGIDWAHPDFISPDGTSRILFLWDMTDTRGPHPGGYSYGTLYTRDQLSNELDGSPAGVVKEKDVSGHGTHVAGIAAGNGRGTGNGKPSGTYKGVAPEADLIVVKAGDDSFITTRISDGLSFVFQKAKEQGKPAVCNLSLGSQNGSHDGTSSFEQGIDGMLWEKGRAVVVAAGNDGESAIHFQKTFTSRQAGTASFSFQIGANQTGVSDYAYFEVWCSAASNFSVSVVSPSGVTKGPVTSGGAIANWDISEGRIYVDNAKSSGTSADNGDKEMIIRVSDAFSGGKIVDNLASGTWKLTFSGTAGQLDGWLYDSTKEIGAKLTEPDFSTLIIEPGNARRVITIAAIVSRVSWPSLWSDPTIDSRLTVGGLCSFSSPGPTRPYSLDPNSRQKPEISAPGQYILSSLSDQITPVPAEQYIATDKRHFIMSGTSMAAPHVTGLTALLFQANPNASVSDVRGKLIDSAKNDAFTGAGWNKFFGYGKADAAEAMRLLTAVYGETDIRPADFSLSQNYPNPFNAGTTLEWELPPQTFPEGSVRIEIVDLRGKVVRDFRVRAGSSGRGRIIWDGRRENGAELPSGMYIFRLKAADAVKSRKMIMIR
jgi:minor extracellular serine protease Vpr